MKPEVVYSTELIDLRPVILYGEPIYLRYEKIVKSLKFYLGDEFVSLLTTPNIPSIAVHGEGKAYWLASEMSGATPFNKLSKKNQEKALSILDKKIYSILELSKKLIEDEDDSIKQLGELLEYSVEIPSEDYIFVKGDRVCLVAWGFSQDQSSNHAGFKLATFLEDNQQVKSFNNSVSTNLKAEEGDSPIQQKIPKESNKKKWVIPIFIITVMIASYFLYPFISSIFGKKPSIPEGLQYSDANEAISLPNDPAKRKIIPDRLVIGLKDGVSTKDFLRKLEEMKLGLDIVGFDDTFDIIQVTVKDKSKLQQVKKKLESLDSVELVVYDVLYRNNKTFNDPALKNKKETYWLDTIGAKNAWKIVQGNKNVVIAVLDVGFDLQHPELKNKVVSPWNIQTQSAVLSKPNVKLAHGTHVAALSIAEPNNAKGIVGVCPKCQFMPIQIGDTEHFTSNSIVLGLRYALNSGASVINLSLGVDSGMNLSQLSDKDRSDLLKIVTKITQQEEKFWDRIFKRIADKGVIVVQAAGNDDLNSQFDPMKRSTHTIIVSATDQSNHRANFSNYSTSQNMFSAPGVHIYSAVPLGNYKFMDGTSMATPIVSGAVALLLSEDSSLNIQQVKDIFLKTGKKVSSERGKAIGPLIQIDKALALLSGKENTNEPLSCEEKNKKLRDRIKKLEKEIDQLSNIQKDSALKIPEKSVDNFVFAEGEWTSSGNLVKVSDNTPIELHFKFNKDGSGMLTLVESSGVKCSASVQLDLRGRKLDIKQLNDALCDDRKSAYSPYTFSCMPESGNSDIARCNAINTKQAKLLEFRLYKDN